MNADGMARKRAAYCMSKHECNTENYMATHEYQRCVQIIIVFLYEVLIMFLSHLVEFLVKLGTEALLNGQRTQSLTG